MYILVYGWPVVSFCKVAIGLVDTATARDWAVMGLTEEFDTERGGNYSLLVTLGHPDHWQNTTCCNCKSLVA